MNSYRAKSEQKGSDKLCSLTLGKCPVTISADNVTVEHSVNRTKRVTVDDSVSEAKGNFGLFLKKGTKKEKQKKRYDKRSLERGKKNRVTSRAKTTWNPLARAPGGTLPLPPPHPPPTVLMMSLHGEPPHTASQHAHSPGQAARDKPDGCRFGV